MKNVLHTVLHRLDQWTLSAFNPFYASYAATRRR